MDNEVSIVPLGSKSKSVLLSLFIDNIIDHKETEFPYYLLLFENSRYSYLHWSAVGEDGGHI